MCPFPMGPKAHPRHPHRPRLRLHVHRLHLVLDRGLHGLGRLDPLVRNGWSLRNLHSSFPSRTRQSQDEDCLLSVRVSLLDSALGQKIIKEDSIYQ